jgi:predicted CXXCH cytochrome family protein
MRRPLWLLAAAVALTGCLDGDTTFSGPLRLDDPPSAAQGFLGYVSGTETRRPMCGNCHVGIAEEWRGTRHAMAWSDLQASATADRACAPCHTVGANGNWVVDTAVGWMATGDARFQDVQCESCHGPGLDHVTNPDASQPLASLVVSLERTNGCGECHQGNHQPFVEEWSLSRHASTPTTAQRQAACAGCHEAREILRAWGIQTNFLEENDPNAIPIVCAVCHDPHNAQFDGQLRFPIAEPDDATNLCMRCHREGGVPGATIARAPHSPQGPLLLGTAGWRPAGFAFPEDTILGTHGTTRNPGLCATCHVTEATVTDQQTGAFSFQTTGHLFQATPCLDIEGRPTTATSCDITQRSFVGCVSSACHATASGATTAYAVARSRVDTLVARLNRQLVQLPLAEFDSTDGRLSTAEGARFNAQLGALRGSAIHNPFLMEGLLTASITAVTAAYGVTPAPRPRPEER